MNTLLKGPFETQRAFRRLLVVGDSISQHGPAPALGWAGNWGMAASRQDADYVHLFRQRVAAGQHGLVPELLVWARGGGTLAGQLEHLARFANFTPDLAVVQMGENDNRDVDEEGFKKPYENILRTIREANPKAVILCLGVWSPPSGSPLKDEMIRAAAKKHRALFVDLRAANADPANSAAAEGRFSHKGVAWHPGDAGMQVYADALWAVLENPARANLSGKPSENLSSQVVFQECWETRSGVLGLATSEEWEKRFPAEAVTGRRVVVEGRVKGSGKMSLELRDAEGGRDRLRIPTPSCAAGWQEVVWPFRMPDNIVEASLVLGVENASGRAWFGDLKITALPETPASAAQP